MAINLALIYFLQPLSICGVHGHPYHGHGVRDRDHGRDHGGHGRSNDVDTQPIPMPLQ